VCGKVGSYHGEGARLYSACRLHKSASTSSRTSLKTDTRRTRRRTAPVNSTTATQRTRRGSHRRPPTVCYYVSKNDSLMAKDRTMVWLRGTKVERWSLTSELSLSCARPAADGWPLCRPANQADSAFHPFGIDKWVVWLQLDVRNLSLERRRLVNAYEVKAGIGVCRLKCVIHVWAPWGRDAYHLRCCISPHTFTFTKDQDMIINCWFVISKIQQQQQHWCQASQQIHRINMMLTKQQN